MKQAKRKKLKKHMRRHLWIRSFYDGSTGNLAVLAPVICPYDPLEANHPEFLQAPGANPLFGTDQLGRDLFTRTLYAARTDLWIMVMAEIAPFIIGIFLGMAAGYFGGAIDWLVGMASDTFIAFPFYLLVIVIAFASGAGSHGIFITYLLVGWLILQGSTRTKCST